MSKVIVYQGYAEKFRWRLVNEDDEFIEQSELFKTEREALLDAREHFPDLEVENRVQKEEETK